MRTLGTTPTRRLEQLLSSALLPVDMPSALLSACTSCALFVSTCWACACRVAGRILQ